VAKFYGSAGASVDVTDARNDFRAIFSETLAPGCRSVGHRSGEEKEEKAR
jgi:hypothetical protein